MKLHSWLGVAAVGVAVSLSAASAFADAIPPDVSACNGKAAGDGCTMQTPSTVNGTCQNSTCTKLDYSHLDDAGVPTSTSYACLQCQTSDGGTSSGGDGGTQTNQGGGGCNAAGVRAAGTFGLALLPLLVMRVFGRRKRNAKG